MEIATVTVKNLYKCLFKNQYSYSLSISLKYQGGEIEDYINLDDIYDKAGAYAIQGDAALYIKKINGDYYNVMGLPVCRLGEVLRGMEGQGELV